MLASSRSAAPTVHPEKVRLRGVSHVPCDTGFPGFPLTYPRFCLPYEIRETTSEHHPHATVQPCAVPEMPSSQRGNVSSQLGTSRARRRVSIRDIYLKNASLALSSLNRDAPPVPLEGQSNLSSLLSPAALVDANISRPPTSKLFPSVISEPVSSPNGRTSDRPSCASLVASPISGVNSPFLVPHPVSQLRSPPPGPVAPELKSPSGVDAPSSATPVKRRRRIRPTNGVPLTVPGKPVKPSYQVSHQVRSYMVLYSRLPATSKASGHQREPITTIANVNCFRTGVHPEEG